MYGILILWSLLFWPNYVFTHMNYYLFFVKCIINFIISEKKKFGHFIEEDPDLLESLGHMKKSRKRKSTSIKSSHVAGIDEDDDEFSPTVKERDRKIREKRKEAAKRVQEGDYLTNINERTKVFSSRKEGLIGKIGDTDSVCGTKTFLIVINMDQEAAFYHGDTALVTQFFSTGISKKSSLTKNYNVRPFDAEELDFNTCSVPHCLVTRNTLSRWRQAAIKMFKFPCDLPMTLHLCPEAERERWMAEIDLDPLKINDKIKLAICSLHFREGYPTDQFPLPTELLTSKNDQKNEFKGQDNKANAAITEESETNAEDLNDTTDEEMTELIRFSKIVNKSGQHDQQQRKSFFQHRVKAAILAKRKRRRWIPSADYSDKKSVKLRQRKVAHSSLFGSRIQCRFCSQKLLGNKQYFQHVRQFHLPNISKQQICQTDSTPSLPPTPPQTAQLTLKQKKKIKLPPVSVKPEEKLEILSMLYPKSRAKQMNPKKKYVCAVCKSSCDLYGLFLHMKQVIRTPHDPKKGGCVNLCNNALVSVSFCLCELFRILKPTSAIHFSYFFNIFFRNSRAKTFLGEKIRFLNNFPIIMYVEKK